MKKTIYNVFIHSTRNSHCRSLNVPLQKVRGWGFAKLQRMDAEGEKRSFSMTILMTSK